jgi:putative transposase
MEMDETVSGATAEHSLSVQRCCRCVGLSRAAFYKTPQETSDLDADVIRALSSMVEKHARWGFWKCFRAMRRLGH